MTNQYFPFRRITILPWKEARLLYHGLPRGAENRGGADLVKQQRDRIHDLIQNDKRTLNNQKLKDALKQEMQDTELRWKNREDHAVQIFRAINSALRKANEPPIPEAFLPHPQRIFDLARELGYIPSPRLQNNSAESGRWRAIRVETDPKKMGIVYIKMEDGSEHRVSISDIELDPKFTIEQKEQFRLALKARQDELEKELKQLKDMLCQTMRLCNELAIQRYLMQLKCRLDIQKTIGSHVEVHIAEYERQLVHYTFEKLHLQHFLGRLERVLAVGETRIRAEGGVPYRVQYTRSGTEAFAQFTKLERLPVPPPRPYEPFSVTRARELANKPPPRLPPPPPDADTRAQQLRWKYHGLHADSYKGRDADPLDPKASREFRAAADRAREAEEMRFRVLADRGPKTPTERAAQQKRWRENMRPLDPDQAVAKKNIESLQRKYEKLDGLYNEVKDLTHPFALWREWRAMKNEYPLFMKSFAIALAPYETGNVYGGINAAPFTKRETDIKAEWLRLYNGLGPNARKRVDDILHPKLDPPPHRPHKDDWRSNPVKPSDVRVDVRTDVKINGVPQQPPMPRPVAPSGPLPTPPRPAAPPSRPQQPRPAPEKMRPSVPPAPFLPPPFVSPASGSSVAGNQSGVPVRPSGGPKPSSSANSEKNDQANVPESDYRKRERVLSGIFVDKEGRLNESICSALGLSASVRQKRAGSRFQIRYGEHHMDPVEIFFGGSDPMMGGHFTGVSIGTFRFNEGKLVNISTYAQREAVKTLNRDVTAWDNNEKLRLSFETALKQQLQSEKRIKEVHIEGIGRSHSPLKVNAYNLHVVYQSPTQQGRTTDVQLTLRPSQDSRFVLENARVIIRTSEHCYGQRFLHPLEDGQKRLIHAEDAAKFVRELVQYYENKTPPRTESHEEIVWKKERALKESLQKDKNFFVSLGLGLFMDKYAKNIGLKVQGREDGKAKVVVEFHHGQSEPLEIGQAIVDLTTGAFEKNETTSLQKEALAQLFTEAKEQDRLEAMTAVLKASVALKLGPSYVLRLIAPLDKRVPSLVRDYYMLGVAQAADPDTEKCIYLKVNDARDGFVFQYSSQVYEPIRLLEEEGKPATAEAVVRCVQNLFSKKTPVPPGSRGQSDVPPQREAPKDDQAARLDALLQRVNAWQKEVEARPVAATGTLEQRLSALEEHYGIARTDVRDGGLSLEERLQRMSDRLDAERALIHDKVQAGAALRRILGMSEALGKRAYCRLIEATDVSGKRFLKVTAGSDGVNTSNVIGQIQFDGKEFRNISTAAQRKKLLDIERAVSEEDKNRKNYTKLVSELQKSLGADYSIYISTESHGFINDSYSIHVKHKERGRVDIIVNATPQRDGLIIETINVNRDLEYAGFPQYKGIPATADDLARYIKKFLGSSEAPKSTPNTPNLDQLRYSYQDLLRENEKKYATLQAIKDYCRKFANEADYGPNGAIGRQILLLPIAEQYDVLQKLLKNLEAEEKHAIHAVRAKYDKGYQDELVSRLERIPREKENVRVAIAELDQMMNKLKRPNG